MSETHLVRCQCGAFQAALSNLERCTRAVCYCRDCQAFAHFLDLPDGMLDPLGGTDIVATSPRYLTVLRGADQLQCMSLSPEGTLRWYTRCCRTPIGNTPRDIRRAHVGLIHTSLEQGGASLDDAFGPIRMRVNAHSAKGTPDKPPMLGFVFAVLRYLWSTSSSRLSGKYRTNPFFAPDGSPRVEPRVLSATEREALLGKV